MNPIIKKKWLEALRSGKYEQGTGSLRTKSNLFCCLGVLCDIVDNTRWDEETGGDRYYYHTNPVNLSFSMRNETNIDDTVCVKLAQMNDTGKSFNEIADWIEVRL